MHLNQLYFVLSRDYSRTDRISCKTLQNTAVFTIVFKMKKFTDPSLLFNEAPIYDIKSIYLPKISHSAMKITKNLSIILISSEERVKLKS